jgi:hypothetical protein
MNRKIAALAAVATLSGAALPAISQEHLPMMTLNCYRPSQGYGSCLIWSFPKSFGGQNTSATWNFNWQNEEMGGIGWLDDEQMPQVWDRRSNQWLSATTFGLCTDNKCLHFSEDFLDWKPQDGETWSLNCLHPVLGENICRVEDVPETVGLRIYWPDNSVDHINFSNFNSDNAEDVTVWSNRENEWVSPNSMGFCANRECLFFNLT